MGLQQWSSAVAAGVFLALGAMAVLRGHKTVLARPLAALCLALFVYGGFETLDGSVGPRLQPYLDWADATAAAMVAPPTLWLALEFLGARVRSSRLLIGATVYFVALALAGLSPVLVPSLAWFPGSAPWAMLMLLGTLPAFGVVVVRLVRHARRSGPEERARTQLFGLAVVLGVVGVSGDLLSIAGDNSFRVSAYALVLAAVILSAVALRAKTIASASALVFANAVVLALLGLLVELMLLQSLGASLVLVAFGGLAVTLGVVALLRPIISAFSDDRARTLHMVTLGRFSAQMAHDLRNPISAIRGAGQFLVEERRQGRSLDPQASFISLIVEQTERMERVIVNYQRLGRLEAHRSDVDLAPLVDEVLAAQRAASSGEPVRLHNDVGPDLLPVHVDRDLLATALENLATNAREALAATGRAGNIRVSATRRSAAVEIRVADDGPWMDPRLRARAFEDFFTTKASGSGLGLSFVKRVAQAHGGEASIESHEGQGTTVVLTFPV